MLRALAVAIPMLLVFPAATGAADDVSVDVIEAAVLGYRPALEGIDHQGDIVISRRGQAAERTIDLPSAPVSQRDARRVVATVRVTPIMTVEDGRQRPRDPWTRVGNLTLVTTEDGRQVETELLRFTTAYGAPGTFQQDVTPLAPLLHGRATLRAFISTYSQGAGWEVSVDLDYTTAGVGARRPAFAERVFFAPAVTAEANRLTAEIDVPPGLESPRLRVLSTGHATDGAAGNEFLSCTHVLRVDGVSVSRWRPWSERGGPLRGINPWAGRREIDGREVRSSDFDRSGWHPGLAVEPLVIPLTEIGPGRHTLDLRIAGIRPKGPLGPAGRRDHGYWMVSAILVADEAWSSDTDSPRGRIDRD